MEQSLQNLRIFFNQMHTRSYAFRQQQLLLLKNAVLKYEDALHKSLYIDLKKSPEECWVTETGFLLSEINNALKHLKKWMQPKKVATNLLNFPSKSFIYQEPLGVVLIVAPWNYPAQLLLTPLVGAIAAGNCAVLKPSEFAPATAAVLKKIMEETFSNHYILFVEGDGATIVPRLMQNFKFDHVFYTGSTAVGKKVYEMAAAQLTTVTLELGGKSPCVVESDADIEVAARRIVVSKFSNAGQMCVAPDYLLVHQSVREPMLNALKKYLQQFFSTNPETDYNYGKIINLKQWQRLVGYLQQGTIIYGGRHRQASLYIEPTLLCNVPPEASIMNEEIFGPLLPIFSFQNFDEAKILIGHNPNPLAFYVFTQSREKEKRWIENVSFGGGCVNNTAWHLTNLNLPFGGRGSSGVGAYHGRHSFQTFSHQKAVLKTPTWFDLKIKYPPFEGKLKLFKKFIK